MTENIDKIIGEYWIDPIIFTEKFVRSCDLCKCSGECCYYGVYTDKYEYDEIIKRKDEIIDIMDDSQTKDAGKWFEPPEEDEDFESGIAVGTELYNGKCVFLDKQGFCALQKLAINKNEDKWKYKPLYCILFPLVIYEDTITVDDEHLARMHFCNRDENLNSTIFDACIDELKYLFGEEKFIELLDYRNEILANNGV